MKNHARICPYLFCNCVKCTKLVLYRDSINRKKRMELLFGQNSLAISSKPSRLTTTLLLDENKTQQSPLTLLQVASHQPSKTQNTVVQPNSTFKVNFNDSNSNSNFNFDSVSNSNSVSNSIMLSPELNSSCINNCNILIPDAQILNFNDNEKLKQMLLFQSLVIASLILNYK